MKITRRGLFLAGAAGGMFSLKPQDLSRMLVLSSRPEDAEMPLDGFLEWITPLDRFFVRTHAYMPEAPSLNDWRLKLDGVVDHPLSLSMDEIKQLPRVELVSVLECAGNGRSFYQPHVPGSQWAFGAVGNARWTGVRLRDVLAKAGVKESAKSILLDGFDVPLGKMPDFQRTVEIKKALDPDTMLAYEMNGAPLPIQHGFPLRLIVPGWAGDSWVKWLQHIEAIDHEFEGFWMKTAYRHPTHAVQPGETVDPKDLVPVTNLNVKSVIATPVSTWIKPGHVAIRGTAWSNTSPVQRVEVSTDGGESWKQAKLGHQKGRYAWRLWQYEWKASPGTYTLMARATNEAGETQPLEEQWNPSGYLWNVVQRVGVEVTTKELINVPLESEHPAYPPGYQQACMSCHDEGMMVQQHLTRAQWDREINKMTGWGAPLKPQDRDGVLNYLSGLFKQ